MLVWCVICEGCGSCVEWGISIRCYGCFVGLVELLLVGIEYVDVEGEEVVEVGGWRLE